MDAEFTNTTTSSPSTAFVPGETEFEEFVTSEAIDAFIAIFLILGVFIVIPNVLVALFYFGKEQILHLMYLILAISDTVAGVGALFHVITLVCMGIGEMTVVSEYLIPIAFFFTSLTNHLSVFFNTILVVIRTINILWPVQVISRSGVYLAVGVYSVLWAVISTFEIISLYHLNENRFPIYIQFYLFIITPNSGSEILFAIVGKDLISSLEWLNALVCIGIPYGLPALITLVCAVVQVASLSKFRVKGRAAARNRKITVTILLLTFTFMICNSAHFSVLLVFNILRPGVNINHWYLLYVCGTFMPLLNSCINPIILVIRGQSLQRYFLSVFGRVFPFRRMLTTAGSTRNSISVYQNSQHATSGMHITKRCGDAMVKFE